MAEIPFWVHDRPKWVSGITPTTTCREILISLAVSIQEDVKKLILTEKWHDVERPLNNDSKILPIWNSWGEERKHVRIVVKRVKNHHKKHKWKRRGSISSMASVDEMHPKALDVNSEVIDEMIKLIQLQRQVIGDELKKAKLKAKREDMKLLIEEMSRLSQLNDKLQFAEESVDRLQIVLREQESNDTYLDLSQHLSGAKEEVSKLKVDNDTNAVEVKENQKALDSMEDLKSERKKALKQLEYDVNVIEKEGRKLAKEYQKVMEIKIDDLGLDQEDIEASDEEIYTLLNRSSTSGHSSELETVSSPPVMISSISKDHEENNENNSDTGLSSLHTSSDEGGTCEVGTLV